MTRLHIAALIAACSVLASACASTPESETTQTNDALLNGQLDSAHKFDVGICAGALVAPGLPNEGTCSRLRCSGTLIAPNLVLTARHCVSAIDQAGPAFCDGRFGAALGPTIRITTSDSTRVGNPKWYTVREQLFPAGNALCSDDLALLVLDAAVPAAEARPATVSLFRNVANAPPRKTVVVGRGVISEVLDLTTFATTTVSGDFKRRILRDIPFDCATDDATKPCVTQDYSSPPTNSFDSPPGYFVIGQSTTGGDSGSGVFDQRWFDLSFAIWRPAVLGVVSAGTYGSDGVPNHGLVTRLDGHRGYILNGLRRAAIVDGRAANAYDGQAVTE
jgi:hypothetical protein